MTEKIEVTPVRQLPPRVTKTLVTPLIRENLKIDFLRNINNIFWVIFTPQNIPSSVLADCAYDYYDDDDYYYSLNAHSMQRTETHRQEVSKEVSKHRFLV